MVSDGHWCIWISLLVQGLNSILENQNEWVEVVLAIQVLRIGLGSPFRDVVTGPQGGVYCLDSSEIFVDFHPLKSFFLDHFIPLSFAAHDPWRASSLALIPRVDIVPWLTSFLVLLENMHMYFVVSILVRVCCEFAFFQGSVFKEPGF